MKKGYYKIVVVFALCIVISGCSKNDQESNTITINNKKINIEIADSWPERVQGLSGRNNLCGDCGLMFVFDNKDIYSFWMKDMNFSIDIIWIDGEKIVYIVENASVPNSDNIPSYIPTESADKVLEVGAGFVRVNNIKIGDMIKN
jgi:uncharacterized protein